jgi:hypothetical protein
LSQALLKPTEEHSERKAKMSKTVDLPLPLSSRWTEIGEMGFISRPRSARRFLIQIDFNPWNGLHGASIYDPLAMSKAGTSWVIVDILAQGFCRVDRSLKSPYVEVDCPAICEENHKGFNAFSRWLNRSCG